MDFSFSLYLCVFNYSRMKKDLFIIIGTLLPLISNATTILNDAVIYGSDVNYPFIPDYTITLTLSIPEGGGLFVIGVYNLGSDLYRFDYSAIAQQYSLFLAESCDVIDPYFVNSTTPYVSNTGQVASPTLSLALGESQFFTYWDDRTNIDNYGEINYANGNDNYGWFKLNRSSAGLEIIEGYTSVGAGIKVGSSVSIPEPASTLLVLKAYLAGTLIVNTKCSREIIRLRLLRKACLFSQVLQ